MKKLIAIVLTLSMALAMTACGSKAPAETTVPAQEAPASALEVLETIWNDYAEDEKFAVIGGSMGGYQSICESALSTLLVKKSAPFKLTETKANVPAFCNLAGRTDNRVPGFTSYTEGMEYFDAAHLSSLLNVPFTVMRVGLGDITCPPNGIAAMLNNLPESTPYEINFLQNSDHGYIPEPEVQKWYKYSTK